MSYDCHVNKFIVLCLLTESNASMYQANWIYVSGISIKIKISISLVFITPSIAVLIWLSTPNLICEGLVNNDRQTGDRVPAV